jgi:hypothetical protein
MEDDMPDLRMIRALLNGEAAHAAPLPGTLLGGAGAVLLAIGAANDTGALAIAGGIVLAVALTATALLNHIGVEYGIFHRLDDLEKGK